MSPRPSSRGGRRSHPVFKKPIAKPAHRPRQFRQFPGIAKPLTKPIVVATGALPISTAIFSTAIRNYGDVFRDRIHGPSYRFHTDSARIWGRGRDIDTESASPYLRKAVLSCYPGFYRSKSAPDGFFNTIQSLRTSNPRHYRAPGRTRDPHPAARFPANGRRTIPTPCEPRLSREHMGVRSLGASRLSVRPRLRPHGPARHVGRGGCPRSSPQTRDRAGLHCHDDLMRPCFFRR